MDVRISLRPYVCGFLRLRLALIRLPDYAHKTENIIIYALYLKTKILRMYADVIARSDNYLTNY